MKKALILIIAGICLFQIKGLSQNTRVGLTGGVTWSNIYGQVNGLDRRGEARMGFTLGMIVDAPLGKSNWAFQPGLHYMQKGFVSDKTPTSKTATALRYAELDLNLIHYTKGATALFFGAGPYIGLNLPSKSVVITDDARIESNITFGKEETDSYRGVDYGANGIVGVRCKTGLYFAVNYAFGIRNILPNPTGDDVLRNGCLGVRIGFIFPNTTSKK